MGLFTGLARGRGQDPMELQNRALELLQHADYVRDSRGQEGSARRDELEAIQLIRQADKLRGREGRSDEERLEQTRQLSRSWEAVRTAPGAGMPSVRIANQIVRADQAAYAVDSFPVVSDQEARRLDQLTAADRASAIDALIAGGRIMDGPYGPVVTEADRELTKGWLAEELHQAAERQRDEAISRAAQVLPEPGDPDDWRHAPEQPGQELRTTFLRDVAATREDLIEARDADAATLESRAYDFESAQRLLQGFDQRTEHREPGYDETTPFSRRTGPEYDKPAPGSPRDAPQPGARSPGSSLPPGAYRTPGGGIVNTGSGNVNIRNRSAGPPGMDVPRRPGVPACQPASRRPGQRLRDQLRHGANIASAFGDNAIAVNNSGTISADAGRVKVSDSQVNDRDVSHEAYGPDHASDAMPTEPEPDLEAG